MPLLSDITRAAVIRQIAGALEVTRTFRVTGIIASSTEVLFTAINFAGMPRVGDEYPGRPEYRVRDITARPDGGAGNDVLVNVVYSNKTGQTWQQKEPDTGTLGQDVKQVSTGLAEFTTSLDAAGSPMIVTVPPSESNKKPYISVATTQRPTAALVFERTETVPPSIKIRNQVGKMNSLDIGPWPAQTLLFTRLDAQSLDGGRIWRTIYEFSFSSVFWNHRDRFTRADGKVPSDAVEQIWQIYDTFDYSTLNLDFSDNQTPVE